MATLSDCASQLRLSIHLITMIKNKNFSQKIWTENHLVIKKTTGVMWMRSIVSFSSRTLQHHVQLGIKLDHNVVKSIQISSPNYLWILLKGPFHVFIPFTQHTQHINKNFRLTVVVFQSHIGWKQNKTYFAFGPFQWTRGREVEIKVEGMRKQNHDHWSRNLSLEQLQCSQEKSGEFLYVYFWHWSPVCFCWFC